MAGFGEEELGIYQKQYVDAAVSEGERIRHTYIDHYTKEQVQLYKRTRRQNKIMLGVDCFSQSLCRVICIETFLEVLEIPKAS